MKPDLIVCQTKACDYPLWRKWLKDYRDYFGKIIIYFNENNRFPYLDHFIHDALVDLGNIKFLDQVPIDWGTQDFRDVATNEMLKHSNNNWVASIEGDFFAKDWLKLLQAMEEEMKTSDLIGYRGYLGQEPHQEYLDEDYVHPCFWYMKRETLEQTSKNFGAKAGEGYDQFGLITREARQKGAKIKFLDEMGFLADIKPDADCIHQGNVNNSYLAGFIVPGYEIIRSDWFYIYNYYSLRCPVLQSDVFMKIMLDMEERLREIHPDIDPITDPRKDFYQ